MTTQNMLPMRGNEIEIRPIYVEEWLDSLPYLDFNTSIKLLQQAMEAMNTMPMKASQRMELVNLFHRPYKYYLDSQIRAGARHSLQSMDAMQTQLTGMKQLVLELGSACRIAMDDALTQKSLFRQKQPPLQEVLMTMIYLSHAMIFGFLEYAPVPENMWKELNFLYHFSENYNLHTIPIKSVATSRRTPTTIEYRYKRIVLIALADPYHLPFGAIWEIYEQLEKWTDITELKPFRQVDDPEGCFVISLSSDNNPLPYEKYNVAKAGALTRLLDTNKLLPVIRKYLNDVCEGKKTDALLFPQYYAEYLLRIIEKAWGKPPKRKYPRTSNHDQLQIAHGLNAIFYFLNDETEFNPQQFRNEDDDVDAGHSRFRDNITTRYEKTKWNIVDTGKGGIAVTRDGKTHDGLRVGDLVGFVKNGQEVSRDTFNIGVLRWLLVWQGKTYKAGVQILDHKVQPVCIRSTTGDRLEREYRRAILIGNPVKDRSMHIITNTSVYSPDQLLEIHYHHQQYKGKISNIEESTTCFEKLSIELQ